MKNTELKSFMELIMASPVEVFPKNHPAFGRYKMRRVWAWKILDVVCLAGIVYLFIKLIF